MHNYFPSKQFGNNRIAFLARKITGFFGSTSQTCSLTPVKAVYSGLAFVLGPKLAICVEKGRHVLKETRAKQLFTCCLFAFLT